MIPNSPRLLLPAILTSLILFIVAATGAQAAASSDKLVGTIISDAFTGAVIINSKGEQTFYRLYEVLPSGLQIVKVRNDSISLKGADATLYDIYINHDMQAVAAVGAASPSAVTASPSPVEAITPAEPVQPNQVPQPPIRRHHVHEDE